MADEKSADLGELLKTRARWFDVRVQESADGGYDVMLRLDGIYTELSDAERIADFWREQIALHSN